MYQLTIAFYTKGYQSASSFLASKKKTETPIHTKLFITIIIINILYFSYRKKYIIILSKTYKMALFLDSYL